MNLRVIKPAFALAACFGLFLIAGAASAADWDPAPIAGSEDVGDKTLLPVVFVHGQNGAGDQFERQAMHFVNNGYPPSWIVAFDYSTAGGFDRRRRAEGEAQAQGPRSNPTTEPLDKLIDEVRKRTGAAKVNLVGHSRGTAESAVYLSDPARAAKVAHYATVGGGPATNPNGVPSIAVSGMGDLRPGPSASNGGKVAWMPDYQDHVMVCTSDESFWAIYAFFNGGKKPKSMRIAPEARPQVAGYVKSYINNKPLGESKVEVWEVAAATGRRVSESPLILLDVADDGRFGPFSAKPGQHYEFVVHGTPNARPPRFFRTPFDCSNRLVYFRIAAAAEDFTPSPFSKSPELLTAETAAFIVRHQNGALLPAVMSLKINGAEMIADPILPTPDGPRQNPTVALYIADGDKDGKSGMTRIASFEGPFVASADVAIPADATKSVEFRLNHHVLNVPAYSGAEAGPISVVFEDFN